MKSFAAWFGDEIELYLQRSKYHRSVSSDRSQAGHCLVALTGGR